VLCGEDGALRLIDPSKGQKCAAGEKAVSWDQAGITWRGPWAAGIGYLVRDAVAYQGSSYLAVRASTGKVPAGNPSDWAVLAQAGKAGPKGAKGAAGPRGPAGPTLLPGQAALGVAIPDVLSASSYGFSNPFGVAFDGSHLWITNNGGISVTEINAADASLVRVLTAGSYQFSDPAGIAFDGSHLWITNNAGNTVTANTALIGARQMVRVMVWCAPLRVRVTGAGQGDGERGGGGSGTQSTGVWRTEPIAPILRD
jgi:hypothetical protein